MNPIWESCKAYFGDGHTPNSSPFHSNVHICTLTPTTADISTTSYGIELNDETISLFPVVGDTAVPECSCAGIQLVRKHIDDYIAIAPPTDVHDYSLHTGKGDKSVEEVCRYILRDAIQWWACWHGTLARHRWKVLYLAMTSVPDDIMIPPQDLVSGRFRFLGHSLADVLEGLRSENVHPDDVEFLEIALCRQYIIQYLEKRDPKLRSLLLSQTTLMTQFRTMTANAHGTAVLLLAGRNIKSRGAADSAAEMAGICVSLSMDMGKESLGILNGERTETVAGSQREQLKRELRWTYLRCLGCLDTHETAVSLRRYATSGVYFVFWMERYRERVDHVRIPLSGALSDVMDGLIGGGRYAKL